MRTHGSARPRIVVVGAGFAGLSAVRELRRANADVVLIDRRNHHLFQPLLYQVATAALSPGHVAAPIRRIVRGLRNVRTVLGEVDDVDLDARRVHVALPAGRGMDLPYDALLLAAGAVNDWFGNEQWAAHATGLKSIEEAIEIRRRFLLAFEEAELEEDDERRRALMTFVVIGGGATGVELAGALAEIATTVITDDFRRIDPRDARVILLEGGPRLLPAMPEPLSDRARRDLEALGVDVRLHAMASAIDGAGVTVGDPDDGGAERIESRTVLWAAGVRAAPVAAATGADADRAGRLRVGPDLSLPGHPEVFALGDLAAATSADSHAEVPGVAQGAIQTGRHAGRTIARELAAGSFPRDPATRPAFRYRDKGTMATIGRSRAVAEIGRLRLGGTAAWLLWSLVHVLFLIGFRNKLLVMADWIWQYATFGRGARLITGEGARASPSERSPATD